MSESVGQKLVQARLQRGLTLDEAARETRMRPEKILALESGDYACFPSNAYAKGFLKNYARYLGVDVAAFLDTLDSSLSISIADYQYLSNAPARPAASTPMRRERRERHRLPIIPLAVAALFVALAFFGYWIRANARRIFDDPRARTKISVQAAPVPVLPAVPKELATPATLSLADPITVPVPPPLTTGQADDQDILKGIVTGDPADHDRVTPLPVPAPATADIPRSGQNEILVASVKKTWVTVRRDDPKATPIFEDFVYPDARPLKLTGTRFFIEARDPAAVQITKNGLPIAYQAPGVPIQ